MIISEICDNVKVFNSGERVYIIINNNNKYYLLILILLLLLLYKSDHGRTLQGLCMKILL